MLIHDISLILSGIFLTLASGLVILGWLSSSQKHLAFFSVIDILWLCLLTRFWVESFDESFFALWGSLLHMLILLLAWGAMARFLLLSVNHCSSVWLRSIKWELAGFSLLGLICTVIHPDASISFARILLCVMAVQMCVLVGWFVWLIWRIRSPLRVSYTFGVSAVFLLLLVETGSWVLLSKPLAEHLALVFSVFLVGASFWWLLLHARVTRAAINELRVSHIQLLRTREAIAGAADEHAERRMLIETSKERKRIAADLHDDLGARLLTIVHTCPDTGTVAMAREALDDMRLSVRGLMGKPTRLGDALTDWRVEIMSRLNPTPVKCEWYEPNNDEVFEKIAEFMLSPEIFVHTTRILREIISNVIKHAKATRCVLEFKADETHMVWSIADDGVGIGADHAATRQVGQGLISMKMRAKRLGGQCLIESQSGQGARIRLTLPFKPADS